MIAAGGLAFKAVSAWLSGGHGAVALGRSAMKSEALICFGPLAETVDIQNLTTLTGCRETKVLQMR